MLFVANKNFYIPFFNYYQIPLFNCKFKRLASERDLAVENLANNYKKKFFDINKCVCF